MPIQGRMRGEYETPKGLIYQPDFITEKEEGDLLQFIAELNYQEVVIHGQAAKRTVFHYGFTYDYQAVRLDEGIPFPPILNELKNKCAQIAHINPSEIVQSLISKYPPGSTIGWHKDKFMFGPQVFGISLGSSCIMRFQQKTKEGRLVFEKLLAPRSLYILSGESRYKWDHSIPEVAGLRYSITFRTLAKSLKT